MVPSFRLSLSSPLSSQSSTQERLDTENSHIPQSPQTISTTPSTSSPTSSFSSPLSSSIMNPHHSSSRRRNHYHNHHIHDSSDSSPPNALNNNAWPDIPALVDMLVSFSVDQSLHRSATGSPLSSPPPPSSSHFHRNNPAASTSSSSSRTDASFFLSIPSHHPSRSQSTQTPTS